MPAEATSAVTEKFSSPSTSTIATATIDHPPINLLDLSLIIELDTFGREVEAGRLVPLYGPAIPSTGSYHLVWPKDRADRAPLRSFRTWLKGEIG